MSDRYLGLSLSGAKTDKTCLTVIDHYHRQDKAFVVDIFESIGSEEDLTSDEVLLSTIHEIANEFSDRHRNGIQVLGVDAPLTFPPCLASCDEDCKGYEKCKRPVVRWMRAQYQKAKESKNKLKHFTPYGQRPVDLYFRYKFPDENLFQDETMGANLAPQAVRMNYLKRHLADVRLIEVWPKLVLHYLQKPLRLSRREITSYRNIEGGAGARQRILEHLSDKARLFIYDRDLKKFVANSDAFDSLICAWVALEADLGRVVKFPANLPLESGWIEVPEIE